MAYVSFADPTNAVDAYEALDKQSFQGRLLHILPAVDRRGAVSVEDAKGKKSLKDDRLTKRKTMAGKDFNWGMLYMNVRTLDNQYIAFPSSRLHALSCRAMPSCLLLRTG